MYMLPVPEFHAEVSEGLAQGPYVAARAGVEPMTLRTKDVDSTNAPPTPSGVNHGGTGRDCPLQSFDWGTAVLTVPPKVQASEGHCWVLHREISQRVYHIL